MRQVTHELVKRLPKVELHIHVESCISAESIERLAAEHGVPMIRPKHELFKFSSLEEFLAIYEWWVDLLRSPEIAEEVAYQATRQLSDEGIFYAEVLTGPRYWSHLEFPTLIESLCRGFERGHKEGFADCRLVPSISREQAPEWAMQLVEWIAETRPRRVVGLGLDGNEQLLGRTSHKFVKAFERAAEIGLGRTAHCGESSGPEGVWDGLNYLDLDRIDHGVRAIEDPSLVERLASDRIPLTICPTSNTIVGLYPTVGDGPIDALFRAGVPVTVNSDDPQCMGITLSQEFMNVSEAFAWDMTDMVAVTRNAIAAAFCDAEQKRVMTAKLDDFESHLQRTGKEKQSIK